MRVVQREEIICRLEFVRAFLWVFLEGEPDFFRRSVKSFFGVEQLDFPMKIASCTNLRDLSLVQKTRAHRTHL